MHPWQERLSLLRAFWLYSGLYVATQGAITYQWQSILLGLCLMSTAYGLEQGNKYPKLVGIWYLLGSISAYTGLFDALHESTFELLFLGITIALSYVSLHLKNKALLATSILAMIGFIVYFSAQHFADSLGWPITLVLMGIGFCGAGSFAMHVKKQMK